MALYKRREQIWRIYRCIILSFIADIKLTKNIRALIFLMPMQTPIWFRGRMLFFTSDMSGNILNFLICCRDLNFKFNLFSIVTDGFTFKCPGLQHTECCVSVLGCILINGPCFVKKIDGLHLYA
jgi:hypothetical protein